MKIVTAEEAMSHLKSNDRVYIHSVACFLPCLQWWI